MTPREEKFIDAVVSARLDLGVFPIGSIEAKVGIDLDNAITEFCRTGGGGNSEDILNHIGDFDCDDDSEEKQ